jgi:hypothetical protein
MSTVRKKCLPLLATAVALGILLPHPSAFAQSSSSVLPTGGGQTGMAPPDRTNIAPPRSQSPTGFSGVRANRHDHNPHDRKGART